MGGFGQYCVIFQFLIVKLFLVCKQKVIVTVKVIIPNLNDQSESQCLKTLMLYKVCIRACHLDMPFFQKAILKPLLCYISSSIFS